MEVPLSKSLLSASQPPCACISGPSHRLLYMPRRSNYLAPPHMLQESRLVQICHSAKKSGLRSYTAYQQYTAQQAIFRDAMSIRMFSYMSVWLRNGGNGPYPRAFVGAYGLQIGPTLDDLEPRDSSYTGLWSFGPNFRTARSSRFFLHGV